jgi:very-short-patch-repair endonuclease
MKSKVIDCNMFYGANPVTFERAAKLRQNMTLAELILWKKLKNRILFKAKFRRQHPVNIFIVDFYCHEFKLAIEIDGEIHLNKKTAIYDSARTNKLEKFGIKILRFSNEQVIFNIDSVINKILNVVTKQPPLGGLGG